MHELPEIPRMRQTASFRSPKTRLAIGGKDGANYRGDNCIGIGNNYQINFFVYDFYPRGFLNSIS